MISEVLIIGLALVLAGSVLGALMGWRPFVFMLMFWVLIEGLVRRGIPGQPAHVMLVADALVLLVYTSYGVRKAVRPKVGSDRLWLPPFLLPLGAFCLFCLLDVLNPSSGGLVVGLVGLHSYVWYVPLLWVGYETFRDLDEVRGFCWWLAAATIPMVCIAFYQHLFFDRLPPVLSVLAIDPGIHSWGDMTIEMVPSTFINAEKFARYCLMTMLLSIGILLDGYGSRLRRPLTWIGMATSFAGIFLSGRRTPLYLSVVALAWLGVVFARRYGARRIPYLVTVTCVLLATAAGLNDAAKSKGQYFRASIGEFGQRANWAWEDIQSAFRDAGLTGRGTGTESQGMEYTTEGSALIARRFSWTGETGIGHVSEELGIVGLGCFLFLWLSVFFFLVASLRRLRGRSGYPVGFALFTFLVLLMGWFAKGHQILGDPITLIHLWFFMGIFFALPSLSTEARCLSPVEAPARLWGNARTGRYS